MARFCGEKNTKPILEAAEYWRDHALVEDGSVLIDENLWQLSNFQALDEHFVDRLDMGEGTYYEKLETQLSETISEVKQLAAEMMWVIMLCPSNIKAQTKRDGIKTIWDWSDRPFPENSKWFSNEVLSGIGSGGTSFNTNRWRELVFFIRMMIEFKSLPIPERRRLLDDGWKFAEWLEKIPENNQRQLRNMLLFLLFPDQFERVFGGMNRREIVRVFNKNTKSQVKKMSALEIDKSLYEIRQSKVNEYGAEELDFYMRPLNKIWKKEESKEESKSHVTIRKKDVIEAIKEVDGRGIQADEKSSTYDLIYQANRYPPKLVYAVAHKYSSGEELDRSTFGGGEDTDCFKTLRDLGFCIERKDFVSILVNKFLKQADLAQNLAVGDYPNKHQGLDVKVSFGKGNFAKVPWVSFTGYDQRTIHGIYPVYLYYKSIGVLILAYGISDTNAPEKLWNDLDLKEKISDHLNTKYNHVADRYGESYIFRAYNVSGGQIPTSVTEELDEIIHEYHRLMSGGYSPTEQPTPLPIEEPIMEGYTINQALDGLFIEPEKFQNMVELLRFKKNMILQGPPGVGKTFFSKRLAYALMGEKAPGRLEMVQFHQSYAYEDFIQGYRPDGTGFTLRDGVFHRFCDKARRDPAKDYVFIIDEINR